MKVIKKGDVAFCCDVCGREAASHPDEREALCNARRVARRDGWGWKHPRWGLRCPICLSSEENNMYWTEFDEPRDPCQGCPFWEAEECDGEIENCTCLGPDAEEVAVPIVQEKEE